MQPVQNCISPTILIGQEILYLPYAGFFLQLHLVINYLTHPFPPNLQNIFLTASLREASPKKI